MTVGEFYKIMLNMYRGYAEQYPESAFAQRCLKDFNELADEVKDCCTEEYENAISELMRHSRLAYILKYNPTLDIGWEGAKYGKWPRLMSRLYGIPTLVRALVAED
jgi:hypothetical protein